MQIPKNSSFNRLPNKKIMNMTKFKAFAEDKLNVAEMIVYIYDRIENIVGKGENAGHQHFLLFPQSFQKPSFSEPLSRDCVVKG